MSVAFDRALDDVRALVTDFAAHERAYLAPTYTEAQARQDFIDKLFTALGWDVAHNRQKNPFQQEVKVERNVKDGVAKRRADYAFYVAPKFRDADVRFFAEAKKPSAILATPDHYFQTVRYGWGSATPLAVLTDFEGLHVLDCRYKPNIDTVLDSAVKRYHFRQYADPETFAELYHLIGRDAVAAGSLEAFADGLPRRRGRAFQRGLFGGGGAAIGAAFLEELDGYREELARSLKLRNPQLDGPALTEIVQRVLDRLVFIRFLEDKLIEAEPLVAGFGDRGSVWGDFLAASRRLDATYNGIVFKKHPLVDGPRLVVDERVFGEICERLAHVNSPYDFNAIPIHILGSIYERFLGRVIVTTEKRAKLEDKPEVRKAGGVYYTPAHIVQYLVEETVGAQIAGKSPAQIAKLRFLDPACGSGSFLLGVYDSLLRYHTAWYNENPDKAGAGDCVTNADGTLQLTLSKRREILVNNVYGVDKDPQAVEVAQLSLYLKLLEDESTATTRAYQLEFHTTLLPSLNDNVVCGNTLIGPDLLEGELELDRDLERQLNPMDLDARFAKVLAAGGFDAVVGNPPYVRPHNITPEEKRYFWAEDGLGRRRYQTFTHKADLYCCFVERMTPLLKPGGRFGYIVSHGWLRLNSFQQLRRHVLDHYRVRQLVELPYRVFEDAAVETGMFVFERNPKRRLAVAESGPARTQVEVFRGSLTLTGARVDPVRRIPQRTFEETFQNVFDLSIAPDTEAVKAKMRRGPTIGDVCEVKFGLKTGDDARFLHHTPGRYREDQPLLRGDDIKRYAVHYKGEYVWYVPAQMKAHRATARPGKAARFEQPKVLVKDTSKDFACTYDAEHYYVKDVLVVLKRAGAPAALDLRYVAGVINSRALRFYYRTTFQTLHVQNEELASLPLPPLELASPAGVQGHDKLVTLVSQMLDAQRRLRDAATERDQAYYARRCNELDVRIDAHVCEIYGLTPDDVQEIEAALA